MSQRRLTAEEIAEVQEMRAAGASIKAVSRKLHINQTTVSRWTRQKEWRADIELLASAFPWSVFLSVPEREEFAYELAHQPAGSKERDIDRFIKRWQTRARAA